MEKSGTILLNVRQYNLICKVQEQLNNILKLIDKGDSDEIVSFETQNALNCLNEILGIETPADTTEQQQDWYKMPLQCYISQLLVLIILHSIKY